MAVTENLLDTLFRGVCRATETNLKLQQQLLLGWSRYWPGFTSRRVGGQPHEMESCRQQWSEGLLHLARAQRELFEQQFEAAVASFDLAMKGPSETKSSGAIVEQPVPASKSESKREPKSEPKTKLKREPAATPTTPERGLQRDVPQFRAKNIYQKVAIVTGAASGIGEAVARELANRGARAVWLVDRDERVQELATSINDDLGHNVAVARVGDTTDEAFRKRVFNDASEPHGPVTICVPAAGITRDALSVRVNKETGRAEIYPIETFRQVTEVNLLAPIYWGVEMVARIAEERARRGLKRWEPEETVQGVVVLLGSVSSQGNKGQIAYAAAKAGLEGAAATLTKEAIFHGVRCGIIHPGFTDTPMARALGDEFLNKYVLPYTQLRRLIRPEEIADAICFMISNSAVSGELWADAGWHPPA